MVNPGAFQGLRKAFLIAEKPKYAEGVAGGFAADALALIQRRYFKRFPVDFPHDKEPSADFLASVDDEEPEPEPQVPDKYSTSPQVYHEAIANLEKRRKLIEFRKAVSC